VHRAQRRQVVVEVLEHVEQQDDVGPADGNDAVGGQRAAADVEPRGARGRDQRGVGLHADRVPEAAERLEHVAGAASEVEQAMRTRRQRAAEHGEDDRLAAAEPPVLAVLLEVDGDVGRIHPPQAPRCERISAMRSATSSGVSRRGSWATVHTGCRGEGSSARRGTRCQWMWAIALPSSS
jgi:hypothetical protein